MRPTGIGGLEPTEMDIASLVLPWIAGQTQSLSYYSARNACIGSTLEARVAGSHTASSATAVQNDGAR